jgi:hypothetical protein
MVRQIDESGLKDRLLQSRPEDADQVPVAVVFVLMAAGGIRLDALGSLHLNAVNNSERDPAFIGYRPNRGISRTPVSS